MGAFDDDFEDHLGIEEFDDREEQWADGYHVMKDGTSIRIKKMTDSHLRNTINLFKKNGYDTSELQKELNKR